MPTLDDFKELPAVEQLDTFGLQRERQTTAGLQPQRPWVAKGSRAEAAAPVEDDGGNKLPTKKTGDRRGDGSGTMRRESVLLARGTTHDGSIGFTDFTTKPNIWRGSRRGVLHDQRRWIEGRQPGCDREHSFMHPKVEAVWETVMGGTPVQMKSSASAVFDDGSSVSMIGIARLARGGNV